MKSKNNTAKIKKLFMKLQYPVFDTHLMAKLKKNSKYEVVFLNSSLAITITEPVPFRIFSK